ncbi:MAG: hypothetical protein JXB49_18665 [Bacteroidales bacterium]|nr:hypothetical protein [Bacteroidales bacterium]
MHTHKIILAVLLVTLSRPVFSQCELFENFNKDVLADTTFLIEFKGYVGYIFPENYHGYMIEKSKKTFTLTESQVKCIEVILKNQYNNVNQNNPRQIGTYRPKNNVNRYLKKYDRQYLGFINDKMESCAMILLANRKGRGKSHFECFERVMSLGFGEFYEKHQKLYIVNLEKEKLIIP